MFYRLERLSKLAIYELKILQNGMIVYEKKFYDILKLNKIDPHVIGMFMDGFVNNIRENTNQELEKIMFRQYAIVFKTKDVKLPEYEQPIKFLAWVIGDTRLSKTIAADFLKRVLELYWELFGDKIKNQPVRIKKNVEMDQHVEAIFGDYYSTSIDRMMNVFF